MTDIGSSGKIAREDVENIYPCTALQEGLIALSIEQPGTYVHQTAVRLPRTLDLPRFQRAWESVVEKESILRTRIIYSEKRGSLQVVMKDKVHWQKASNLEVYLEADRNIHVQYGDPLTRYALVDDGVGDLHFVWTAHHAVYDGWSVNLILNKVQLAFGGSPLPQSTPFINFIKYLTKIDARESDSFWKSHLQGVAAPKFPPLPSRDHQFRTNSSFNHEIHLRGAPSSDVTISTKIRAAWAIVLSNYEDSCDIVFGATITGRDAPIKGIEDIVGPTIATVPVRLRVDQSQRVKDFLAEVQTRATDCMPFEHRGLQYIKRLNDDTQKACQFRTLLAISPLGKKNSEENETGIESIPVDIRGFHTYGLVFYCDFGKAVVEVKAEYDKKALSEEYALGVAFQFEHVLKQLDEIETDATIASVEVFSPHDIQTVNQWNGTLPERLESCIHELFAKQAASQPEKPAICAWDGVFTYREVDQLSTKLAHHLTNLGVRPEVKVPLCFDKSAWTVIAQIAVLKAGGAVVSLHPAHPLIRLQSIIRDVNAKTLLVASALAKKFTGLVENIVSVDSNFLTTLPSFALSPVSKVKPFNPAFVIYTSGSTGSPKGVVLEHTSVCTSVAAHGSALQIGPDSRVLQFAAYVFDISISDIFATLTRGGCVCVISEYQRDNELVLAINNMKVNTACITPSIANLFKPSDVPSLNTLILAGEALSRKTIDIWSDVESLNNCYGPAESTIYCAWNGKVGQWHAASNIGRGLASLLWVVNATDHNRLAPIGCVGELMIEGPLLARGYLNDYSKTARSFIIDPAWIRKFGARRGRRFYKTGDLVRWNRDGTLDYVERKDTQIKIHGQRLELGEVEHHLLAGDGIANAMVTLPISGPFENRLLAIIEIVDADSPLEQSPPPPLGEIHFLEKTKMDRATLEISHKKEYLATQLPAYMIPSLFIVVQKLPLSTSGKLDRASVNKWIIEIDEEQSQQATKANFEVSETVGPTTIMDRKLVELISHVLNVPAERVLLNQSFLGLGGDSIAVMQVVSKAKQIGINIKAQDILQSKTIAQLALVATANVQRAVSREDELDTLFDLSPVQQMYFQLGGNRPYHFNQSFYLRLRREFKSVELEGAISAIIRQHSMLRVRLKQKEDGRWSQYITKDVHGSYRFKVHSLKSKDEVSDLISTSQRSLNITAGPIFNVDVFNIENAEQLIFMAAHHISIDMVSWRVIMNDLEELLRAGTLSGDKPFPFQAWCRLQAEYSRKHLAPKRVLPFEIHPADYSYWGMKDQSNVYDDTITEHFLMDAQTTSSLLKDCHQALNTTPAELFVSTLLQAFAQTFADRQIPTIWGEGHGRETWDAEIDLSSTVGWFTTMSPIHVQIESTSTLVDVLRRTKDRKRKLPHNGWEYFTSRYSNTDGIEAFKNHLPMEVLFNYLGRYQQLERAESLMSREAVPPDAEGLDIGRTAPRLALFEISVMVIEDIARFSIVYNRRIEGLPSVNRWMKSWEQLLQFAANELPNMKTERTLSDLPLLNLTYDDLNEMENNILPKVGVTSFDQIEDVYPCSPMQQGILFSQSRENGKYHVHFMFNVALPEAGRLVDVERLLAAWQLVVNRHAALRTIFVESVTDSGSYDQIVLKDVAAEVEKVTCSPEAARECLDQQRSIKYESSKPPHRLIVCEAAQGSLMCKLEISHAIIDATSYTIMLRDLALAYEGNLPAVPGPRYSRYIEHIQQQPPGTAIKYWKDYLADVEPCIFPVAKGLRDRTQLQSLPVKLDAPLERIQAFCTSTTSTVANLISLVWGLVLRCYTGSDNVCFGYLTSGREIGLEGVEETIGPFVNMLISRINITADSTVQKLVEQVQSGYAAGLEYQHCWLAEIQHELALGGPGLFNTAMSVQRVGSMGAKPSGISIQTVDGYDPSEYDILLYGTVSDAEVEVKLSYWASQITEWQMSNVASTFAKILNSVIDGMDKHIAALEMSSSRDVEHFKEWNAAVPPRIDRCVHETIQEEAQRRPEAPAICAWDYQCSFLELDDLSSRLACHLSELGVKGEVMVPICFNKSAWTIVAMLGVIKAGGAFTPLDPSYPLLRLEGLVQRLDCPLILMSPETYKARPVQGAKVILISEEMIKKLPTRTMTKLNMRATPQNAMYVLFTSGSTGEPKGVVVEHASISTSIRGHGQAMGIDRFTRALQFASYGFDISITEIFTTLVHGGCVCVPSDSDRYNDIVSVMNEMDVNWACFTPSFIRILSPGELPRLRTLVLAGEAILKENIELWADKVQLINGYGPTEASVFCLTAKVASKACRVQSIGRSVSSVSWITDPQDHNRLVPLGSIGELSVEGPILARGYLGDKEKTQIAFVDNPTWAEQLQIGSRRIYKTGDLVRYNHDGTIDYLGRKDGQVKINGQRMDLGEVEHHLSSGNDVGLAMVMLAKSGCCQGKLVAIVERRDASSIPGAKNTQSFESVGFQLVNEDRTDPAYLAPSNLRSQLTDVLPSYMIPAIIVVVRSMPLNASGKLDRRKVASWIHDMDAETYNRMIDSERVASNELVTPMGRRMQSVISQVLNISSEEVALHRSFVGLGGDSITAMQVVSRCRAEGISTKVQEVLQSKNIAELAQAVRLSGPIVISRDDTVETLFPLSPVQRVYMKIARDSPNRFNQSFLLRLAREFEAKEMVHAMNMVVSQHSMLRARFCKDNGLWLQKVTRNEHESYQFEAHDVKTQEQIADRITACQMCLDVENGPIFAVEMMTVPDEGQLLFLTAHHLVIDHVSWRIILQDIENVLENGTLFSEQPLPFQSWVSLQTEYALDLKQQKLLPFDIVPADYGYWGMASQPNNFGNSTSKSFVLEADMTSVLFGDAQRALGTEPVEVLIGTMIHAFRQIFRDRDVPIVYSEGHGREPWDESIDLSSTVGWFTTMIPLYIADHEDKDLIDLIRRAKDVRRSIPGNGLPYFTTRILSDDSALEAFDPRMEVLFNYLGRYQQLERKEGLLQRCSMPASTIGSEVAPDVPRLALFDISVMVIQDVTRFTITFDKHMLHEARIECWVQEWNRSIQSAVVNLSQMETERTLSDFPLLRLSYSHLGKLKNEGLAAIRVASFEEVEDVYPCSPIQQGLLIYQSRDLRAYQNKFTFEVISQQNSRIDTEHLLSAWQFVVDRHPALRTIFIDSLCDEGFKDQLVLKHVKANTSSLESKDDFPINIFDQQPVWDPPSGQPVHRLSICKTAAYKVFIQLEITHALVDATSLSILLRDLAFAYQGLLSEGEGPLYSDYIRHIQGKSRDLAVQYWSSLLHGVNPCYFPLSISSARTQPRALHTVDVTSSWSKQGLSKLCETNDVTVASVVNAAWGLVLRNYTDLDTICFGYLVSGRDVPVKSIEEAVGPFINMLICRMNINDRLKASEVLKKVQDDYGNSLEHQNVSLADIQHSLGLSGQPLFNTAVSVQRSSSVRAKELAISFKNAGLHDPTEASRLHIFWFTQ